MEYSMFMIKPCAYKNKQEILDIISKKLNILFTRDIVLDECFLDKLYKNEQNETYKKINKEQLNGGHACVGIVSGENAIKDLIKICGDKPLGRMCDKNSIRYRYSPQEDIIHIGDEIFFVNAIHKPNPKEVQDIIKIL